MNLVHQNLRFCWWNWSNRNKLNYNFFSLSHAFRNSPIISFLAADFASSANIAKSTAFIRVFINFSFRWELRATSIESQESEESYAAFLVCLKILLDYWFSSSDQNLIIFGYNSFTGQLLRAKKWTILISFLM